ncbi:SET domain-containing protein [Heterostelium album PN500]|uniref:SET domain-containing protein n=1 Tax=Heterostelium pallidum (strain ATCC 26659 / Pp 5 / PN500) TaxID=670386 RepID=D3BE73_HETP5|nr:SET domain-containing protein [Heterostelium album PN500]EFA80204.1 SET domain-containing protein [Heterostelium album PN500]|eukprot:XP_020432324.1 SET domain-containing protein [Heterostelium album PN500]
MSEYREKGNQYFKAKQLEEALWCYTQAIEFDGNDHLSYTNRSLAFYMLSNYLESLKDANNAIAINSKWFKAYFRKSLALKQLSRYQESLESLDSALVLIENNNNNNINTGEMKSLIQQFNQEYKDISTLLIDSRYKLLTKEMNVDVAYINRYKGKGVVSKSNYQANQDIFQESPLVSHISYKFINNSLFKCCSHCLSTRLDVKLFSKENLNLYNNIYSNATTMIRCERDGCNDVYCSIDCLNHAKSQYHQVICSSPTDADLERLYAKAIEYKQTNPLVILRIYASILQNITINKLSINNSLLPFTSFVSNGEWTSQNDTEILSILKDIFKEYRSKEIEIDNLFTINKYREFNSIIQCNASHVNPPSDIHMYINDLVAKTPLSVDHIVVCGKKVTFDNLPEYLEKFSDLCISGSALFPIVNSCNHHCNPNAVVSYTTNCNRVTLRSLRSIPIHEEVEISYIDETVSCSQRRKELQHKYLFNCKCTRCLCEQ